MSEVSIALPEPRILLIDADRTFHAVLQAAASALPGTQLLCCAAPGEALNRMDKFVPALFIIDGRIGGAAGINFVRRVRAGQTPAPAGTLVMFVAQDFSGGLSGKLVDVGCHAIVRKPLSPDALARAVVRIFESPVPFVMGGQYLGPDRRKQGGAAKRDPERRRDATRGGWGSTPQLARGSMPLVTMAAPDGNKPKPASNAIEAGPAPAARPKAGGGRIEGLDTPEPKQKERVTLVDDAPAPVAAKAKQSLVDDAPAPKKTRDAEPMELAAPAKAPDKEPEFDVGAVVESHRQWIASNGTQGAKANLEGMVLPGVSLSGHNLAKANLRGTDLSNADLSNCILLDADMRNAILSQALLAQAQMAGAKVRHADMQFAQMSECGLQGSDLAGADLRGAVLAGADLSGANLLGVDLRGADCTAINLTQKQLDRARGDHTTKLPPGLFVRMGEAIE